ncbi:thiamine phosphate synthase [Ectothiorhodospira mobilis]|uniref:thiamine phosphate synthase n=1 Tax=Ectothiorhodospira mobilis TaxID=195064 RepID=UPI001EE87627|nr:thiamine phosphate synthase [Ectothiorhodospira mobilis]MCG5535596.1 thiamine phosphate synthase [Ectothiorhodospira mobilis]
MARTNPTEALRGLYLVTPEEAPHTLLPRVEQALQGGARILQYRDKSGDATRRLETARALKALCADHHALFLVNDDVELAAAVAADGVHLGREDTGLEEARAALGPEALIGVSCYDRLERAEDAAARGADYVAFGAVFPSSTKPGAVHAPLALIREARTRLHLPIAAIGGITPDNAAQVVHAGAHMVAVIQGVFGASAPRTAAAHIRNAFYPSHPGHSPAPAPARDAD